MECRGATPVGTCARPMQRLRCVPPGTPGDGAPIQGPRPSTHARALRAPDTTHPVVRARWQCANALLVPHTFHGRRRIPEGCRVLAGGRWPPERAPKQTRVPAGTHEQRDRVRDHPKNISRERSHPQTFVRTRGRRGRDCLRRRDGLSIGSREATRRHSCRKEASTRETRRMSRAS